MAGGKHSNCGTKFNILFYRVRRLQSHNVANWISMLWRMKHHTCGKTEFLCFHPKDKTPAPRLDTGCSEKAAPRTTAARSVASHNRFLMYVAHIIMHCKIERPDLSGGFLASLIRIDATNSAGSFNNSKTCTIEEVERINVTINSVNRAPN